MKALTYQSMSEELAWRSPYWASPVYSDPERSARRVAVMNGELTPDQEAILRLIGPSGTDGKAERKRRVLKARLLGIAPVHVKCGPKPGSVYHRRAA